MSYNAALTLTTISLASVTQSTWTTLATGVPSGSSGVKLLWVGPTGGGTFARGVRMGPAGGASSDTFVTASTIVSELGGVSVGHEWNIGVDSSQQIQYYSSSTVPTEGTLYVLGNFNAESVFFLNAVSLGAMPTTIGTIAASSAIPSGGIAGFFTIAGGDYDAWLCLPTSSDNYRNGNEVNGFRHWLVGCDGSQNIRGVCAFARTLYCQGYMTSGIVWHQNAVAVTPGTAGSLQPVSQAGGDTGTIVANLYYANSPSTVTSLQLVGQGASVIPALHYAQSTYAGQMSAYAPSQANMSSVSTASLYELAYFTGAAAPFRGPMPRQSFILP